MSYFFNIFNTYCCVNTTSTTEIETYGHTLSLHDALPIVRGQRQAGGAVVGQDLLAHGRRRQRDDVFVGTARQQRPLAFDAGDLPARVVAMAGQAAQRAGFGERAARLLVKVRAQAQVGRSEEHTSELQSLMRHTYAVLCF